MNRSNIQDIKLVERFKFDNSIYMLNMFQKKIDSFITYKQKKVREKELQMHRQQNNRIDPNHFFDDPIKTLSKDLTKPIWNCITRMDPTVYIQSNQTSPSSNQMSQDENILQQIDQKRVCFNSLIKTFLHRYKTQHQDQSNLKININQYNQMNKYSQFDEKDHLEYFERYTEQLMNVLMRYIKKDNEFLESLDLSQIQENYSHLRSILQAYYELLSSYLEENQTLKNSVNWYLNLTLQAMMNMLDSKAGPTLFLIQPKIGVMSLMVHPLLLTVYNTLTYQFNYNDKDKGKKVKNQNMQDEKIEVKQIVQEQSPFVFMDLRYVNCSKIAFINLDGYESEFNLEMAKYLSKNMLYVSFPKQSSSKNQLSELYQFQQAKSERLLSKYYNKTLKQEQKTELLRYFQIDQKQLKKNMFILPIHSRSMSEKYNLKSDQNGNYSSIQFYESSFVKFMMQQVVMSYLRENNPSCIILSYSGKIKLQNQYFVELIKQLTVISNFRLLFYPNKTKMFCFQEKNQQIVSGEDYFNQQYEYYKSYQQSNIDVFYQKNSSTSATLLNQFNTRNLDFNFLQKISIFLKVSSGTYNLSKNIEEDSHIEKYKNYKIMRYSALLLKQLAKQYPAIQRIKMRANQYLTISKVLKNSYANKSQTFDKLFEKVVTKYHENLMKIVEKFIFIQNQSKKLIQINDIISSDQQSYLYNQCAELLRTFSSIYEEIEKKQLWENFKFQYRLELSTEKTQSRVYLHIPKFKDKQALLTSKSPDDFIAAVEFQILDEKQKIPVELTPNSKILYSKDRTHKDALVYVINHIAKQSSTSYTSFYGILNEFVDQKTDYKISLKPIIFHQERRMSQFQNYIDFNYYETNRYVFLFWPRIFNDVKQKICRLIGQKYIPETTWSIFRAQKQEPGTFYEMTVINQDYQYVIPRNGCIYYQPRENMNRFYIFGGFYNDTENYLKFQTDVSYIDFLDQSNDVKLYNLPKNLFILTQINSQMQNTSIIKQFKNDFIRPKVQYQIFEPEKKCSKEKKQIFLIGGIGEKFTRTFSLISYTGSKVTFLPNGQIESIKKIKTNNLLPVNTYSPLKIRSPQEMNVISNAQNRILQINEGNVTQQSYTMSHFRYKYDQNQEKFDYETVYEFADLDKKSYRDQTQYLRRPPSEFPTKYQLMASSFRGRQYNDNFIKVSSENGKKYIFELQLQLSTQVKNIYPNYQKVVKLTGASIKAIDINASMLYCLIKHQFYTLDRCILAHFDINEITGKLVDSKQVEINLKQIHKFDADVSKNIIVVANSGTVAVLHGFKLNSEIEIKQIVLKKSKKLKILTVLPSTEKSQLIDNKILNKRILYQIATSFFINQNTGIIICLTFKTIDRQKIVGNQKNVKTIQTVYIRIEKLDIKNQQCKWSMIFERIYKLQICSDLQSNNNGTQNQTKIHENNSIKNDYLRLIQVKGNKQSKQKKQKEYFIKAIYKEQVYTCALNTQLQTDSLIFMPMKQSSQAYYKSIYKENIKNESIILDKGLGTYEEIKEEAYNNYMQGGPIGSSEKINQEGQYTSKIIREDSIIEFEDNN